MVSKEKIARINELAKISKIRDLTADEQKERALLREEYISSFRKSFKDKLDCIEIVD